MPRFLLARHGETNFNREKRVQGSSDLSVLLPDGIAQAAALGMYVSRRQAGQAPDDVVVSNSTPTNAPPITRTWCSPLTRCRQTYAAVSGCCSSSHHNGTPLPDPTIHFNLREKDMKEWEGKLRIDIGEEIYAAFKADPLSHRLDDGKFSPLLDCWERASSNWSEIRSDAAANTESAVFVMFHGSLGNCMLLQALGMGIDMFDKTIEHKFDNCDCIELDWADGDEIAMRWRRVFPEAGEWQSTTTLSSSSLITSTNCIGDIDLPTYQDVVNASRVIQGVAHYTPLQTSRILDEELGVNAYIKCENFQRMGAFKFRGGYTAISHYKSAGELKHVLTYSSGNHAQAIALASSMLGVKSTIIMPLDAPALKLKATKSYGGNIVFYDRYKEQRDEVAERVKATLPMVGTEFIPPYDHRYVIAGQGTVGKEMIEELHSKSVSLDYLFVCVGGGGLISGICLATQALSTTTKVIGVEPEAGNDAQQSLQQGQIVHIETPRTIADGAQTQHLGKLTFTIMSKLVSQIITVTDDELISGMKFFGETMKMVVEPTGCLGLCGLRKMIRSGEIPKGSNCGVVISGGNVDMKRYCELISSSLA